MKAAVFHGPGHMQLEEIEKPQITAADVLVKINVSAVCGTDVRIFDGKKTKGVRLPSVIGHEMVGTIEQVGEAVSGFAVGDRVGVIPVIPCGKCLYCLSNRENACANRTAIGYEFDGGFAEYVRIPGTALAAGNLTKIPDHVTFEQAVIAEPLSCCINGNRKSNIQLNDTVVVVGAGPIGLMHVQLAKLSGASKIIVSELIEHRLDKALEAGATTVVNTSKESLYDVVMRETDGLGADAVIMAIGVSQIVNDCLKLVRKGGSVNLFAGFNHGAMSDMDPNLIHYNEITVVGTTASTRADYHKALSLISAGLINTDVIITEGYTLETIEQAILDVKTGKGMKSVIQINQ
ncbi:MULTISPECIES: zinc-dependent dehydrogenase [unclassified Paenibacillus]|uniref:zinc-dependent dehydrogenase n=1 Tax=unclassified Paenibacillus TaxID=185978 RepID=UPI001AE7612C|nr:MULTISPECIES: zinc-dependent dehydrogenase [unclassified Paenibacillus]MBP1154134.1 L-iditol 2-dehydrogenase [Paenibacillus sp. PvP091]MBP1170481.1 L-iditol 2-dehydrogenase [Paenibacillus sp. PvR098]MBP2441509.1 L-iditol 2-dehydrogenase [Paenibacillus sp. PvP052]